jgi:GNAT superfamily N-acetyltransferase
VSDILIHDAQPADTPAIAAVLRAAFAEYRPLYTAGGYDATTPDAERITQRLSEGPIWVALRDNRVVGTVAAVDRPDGLYVRGMGVVPEDRGHALGWRLLQQVERYALAHGHVRMHLSTTPFLARAIRLYEQFGFVRTDEEPHDLFGTPLFTMAKLPVSAGDGLVSP